MKTLLITLCMLAPCLAQEAAKSGPEALLIDPSVRVGQLENGLTYYIKHNRKPEQKLELRLAVNAGSILEDDDQLGLAHFVEHMAFNGTKHFKKNQLVSYLQSIGVEFGADLNAFTGFDQTVYILPIPTADPAIVEQGFQVLADWAYGLDFDHQEIDKERGVVIEEWRLGQGAQQRMMDAYLPIMLKGSRYADRLPIGSKDIIQNASYDAVKRFYREWYRPDLMAVIAVGDLDPDLVETKIKRYFSAMPRPSNPRERKTFSGPRLKEERIAIETDPEASFTLVDIGYLHDRTPARTTSDYRAELVSDLWATMVNQRLEELKRSPEAPFAYAFTGYGRSWVKTQAAYSVGAMVPEGGVLTATEALLREIARVRKHGFQEGEFERAKRTVLEDYERALKEKDKTESSRLVWAFVWHFLAGESAPGPVFDFEFATKSLPGITLDEVNALLETWMQTENRYVVITGPEKDGLVYPSAEEIHQVLVSADNVDVTAYQDTLTATQLMEKPPQKVAIKSRQDRPTIGVTELSLANGMRIVLKPTDFKDNEVILMATSQGGMSLYSDEDYLETRMLSWVMGASGLADFSQTDLEKLLAGKTVYLRPFVGDINESLRGRAASEDLETLFQLLHLQFSAPRNDPNAFHSEITGQKAMMKNQRSDPMMYFHDQAARARANNHVRSGFLLKEAEWDQLNHSEMQRIFEERFANPGDFTVVMVGSFNLETALPLIETYLANLPGEPEAETFKDVGMRAPKGKSRKVVRKGVDPKSMVNLYYTTDVPFTQEDDYLVKSLCELMNIKLVEILREEMSGVYGVGAYGGIRRAPHSYAGISVSFPCAPENVNTLTVAVTQIIESLKAEGPSQSDVAKVQEAQRLDLKESLKTNRYWVRQLVEAYTWNEDPEQIPIYEDRVSSLSADRLRQTANRFFNMENVLQIELYPENWQLEEDQTESPN